MVLLPTAPVARPQPLAPMQAAAATDALASLGPEPWPVDRAGAAQRLAALDLKDAVPVWLSDGLGDSPGALVAADHLGQALSRLGPLKTYAAPPAERAALLRPPDDKADDVAVTVERVAGDAAARLQVEAHGSGGETLARVPVAFDAKGLTGQAKLDVPADMRNRIARLELTPSQGVGGVVLLDERWKRRTAGILGSPGDEADQPLLAERYFLAKALAPYADLREGPIDDLTQGPLSLLVMPDTGRIDPGQRAKLEAWMDKGGVLVRFAGPRLAASGDELVPVPLRQGDRMLGGALTWQQPLKLAPFDPDGPVRRPADARGRARQPPGAGRAHAPTSRPRRWPRSRTARRLITQARHGKGLADPGPHHGQHGLELAAALGRVRRHAAPDHGRWRPGPAARPRAAVEPSMVLDGFGRLAALQGAVPPIPAESLAATPPAPDHPPGLYAPVRAASAGSDEQPARLALNLQPAVAAARAARPRDAGPGARALRPARRDRARALAALDRPAAGARRPPDRLWLRGLTPRLRGPATAAAVALLAAHAGPAAACWRPRRDDRLAELANETHLAYVITGDAEVDEISEAGLKGLTRVLEQRTAVEAAEPVAVDLGQGRAGAVPAALLADPARPPGPGARDRAPRADYLRHGGMILFDTRDGGDLAAGPGRGRPRRAAPGRACCQGLDLPPLEPVPVRPRADPRVLPAAGLPRPLGRPAGLGRPGGPGRERRRVRRSSSAPTTGPAPGRSTGHGRRALPVRAGRREPARDGLPLRRQPRDVCADRQLQDRPGPRPGSCSSGSANDAPSASPSPRTLPLVVLLAALGGPVLALALRLGARARGIGWRVLCPRPAARLPSPTRRCAASSASRSTTSSLLVDDRLAQPAPRATGRRRPPRRWTSLRARLAADPGLELREVDLAGDGRDGTPLFAALRQALAETDRARLGAVVALTDGEVARRPQDAERRPGARCTSCSPARRASATGGS